MTDMARLEVLFEELGSWQRAVDERPLVDRDKQEILSRLREANRLLPPGNAQIFNDFRRWVMRCWAVVMQRHGDADAEKWRVFLSEVGDVLGPAPD